MKMETFSVFTLIDVCRFYSRQSKPQVRSFFFCPFLHFDKGAHTPHLPVCHHTSINAEQVSPHQANSRTLSVFRFLSTRDRTKRARGRSPPVWVTGQKTDRTENKSFNISSEKYDHSSYHSPLLTEKGQEPSVRRRTRYVRVANALCPARLSRGCMHAYVY